MAQGRFLAVSCMFQFRMMIKRSIYIFETVAAPPIIVTIVFKLHGADPTGTEGAISTFGVAIACMWSTVLSGTGPALTRMRFLGLLEPVVAAPTPLASALVSTAVASGAVGLFAVPSTLLWVYVVLGAHVVVASPTLLAGAILAMVVSTASLGLLLCLSIMLYPRAQAIATIFELPVWLLIGVVVPLSLLPNWVGFLSWFISPAWGMKAIQGAITGDTGWAATSLLICIGTAAACLMGAALIIQRLEKLAREKATIPLR